MSSSSSLKSCLHFSRTKSLSLLIITKTRSSTDRTVPAAKGHFCQWWVETGGVGGEVATVTEKQQVLAISTSALLAQSLLLVLHHLHHLLLLVDLLLRHLGLARLLLAKLLPHTHRVEGNSVNWTARRHFCPLHDAHQAE